MSINEQESIDSNINQLDEQNDKKQGKKLIFLRKQLSQDIFVEGVKQIIIKNSIDDKQEQIQKELQKKKTIKFQDEQEDKDQIVQQQIEQKQLEEQKIQDDKNSKIQVKRRDSYSSKKQPNNNFKLLMSTSSIFLQENLTMMQKIQQQLIKLSQEAKQRIKEKNILEIKVQKALEKLNKRKFEQKNYKLKNLISNQRQTYLEDEKEIESELTKAKEKLLQIKAKYNGNNKISSQKQELFSIDNLFDYHNENQQMILNLSQNQVIDKCSNINEEVGSIYNKVSLRTTDCLAYLRIQHEISEVNRKNKEQVNIQKNYYDNKYNKLILVAKQDLAITTQEYKIELQNEQIKKLKSYQKGFEFAQKHFQQEKNNNKKVIQIRNQWLKSVDQNNHGNVSDQNEDT